MKVLAFDTETSGFALFDKPASDPSQPYLVEFGAALFDDGKLRQHVSMIVKPRNFNGRNPHDFTIPEESSKIHGITDAYAMRNGFYARDVFNVILSMMMMADVAVAHNLEFDRKILDAMAFRFGSDIRWPGRLECTMKAATEAVGARGANGRLKWPKLAETYRHFFGRDIEDAHSAYADAKHCGEIWLHMNGQEKAAAAPKGDAEPDFPL